MMHWCNLKLLQCGVKIKLNMIAMYRLHGAPSLSRFNYCSPHWEMFEFGGNQSITKVIVDAEKALCSSHPCINDAICTESRGQFQCQCATGWIGKICEISELVNQFLLFYLSILNTLSAYPVWRKQYNITDNIKDNAKYFI